MKSSKKRIKTNIKRQQKNISAKTGVRTAIKNVEQAIAEGDLETAKARYSEVVSALDSAVAKNIMKKNTASRKKSQLAKGINAIQSAA